MHATGATVACKPTNVAKNGVKSVVNVASREIAGTVIGKAEVALTKTVANGVKQGAKTATQKTALVAERNIIKNEINPLKGTSYTTKVLDQMRCNARTSLPDFHGFPRIVDNYASLGSKELIVGKDGIGRIKISLPGGYRGKEGYFEWIIENNNTINHRLFVPNP